MDNLGTFIKVAAFTILTELAFDFCRSIYWKFMANSDQKSLTHALKHLYDEPNNKNVKHFNKVIFFPDPGIACRRILSGRECHDQHCSAVHDKTSLSVLISVLNLSQHTVDVCVYMITCGILGDALVDCQKRGVVLRVVTEERNSGEEGEMSGSQIGKLRAAAIQVRCRASSFWMHHKFCIVDNEILVNGSFNWTNQAVMGNSENLIITNEKTLIDPFKLEFQRLWDNLSPQEFLQDEDIKNCNF